MNKTSLKTLALSGFLMVGSLVLVQPVFAQTQMGTIKDTIVQNRCDRVTERIDTIISNFDQNKDKHIDRYNKVKNSVTELIQRLSAKNYDVTKITADLQTLDSMTKDFAAKYSTAINTLKSSKAFACGNSEGQFKATVEQGRAELKDSREQSQAIIDFIQNTIRPDMKDLKNQNPKNQ